jgi:hypothetical protein
MYANAGRARNAARAASAAPTSRGFPSSQRATSSYLVKLGKPYPATFAAFGVSIQSTALVLEPVPAEPAPRLRPNGISVDCAENNPHVVIGNETYMMSADGYLMPTKPDQPPPELRYFNKARK